MPQNLGQGNAQYTPIVAAGTNTLNPGPALTGGFRVPQPPTTFGVLYGVDTIAAGTGFAYTLVDMIAPTGLGTNTATVTNTLMNGTDTAGTSRSAGVSGVGVRYSGALVCITTGTPGQINVAWD